jgi:hypothetical protein
MGPEPQPPPEGRLARALALAVTNVTKLAGVAIAFNEALLRANLRPIAMGVAAIMIAGARAVEQVIERLFGGPPP